MPPAVQQRSLSPQGHGANHPPSHHPRCCLAVVAVVAAVAAAAAVSLQCRCAVRGAAACHPFPQKPRCSKVASNEGSGLPFLQQTSVSETSPWRWRTTATRPLPMSTVWMA